MPGKSLLRTFVNYGREKFYNISSECFWAGLRVKNALAYYAEVEITTVKRFIEEVVDLMTSATKPIVSKSRTGTK